MKVFVVLTAVVMVALAAEFKYPTKYHKSNLYEILRSDRLLNSFFKCLMDEGPCTPDGKELRRVIPNNLENGCQNCTKHQSEDTKMVMKYLTENKHDMWLQLKQKYDPKGNYQKKYSKAALKHGINV